MSACRHIGKPSFIAELIERPGGARNLMKDCLPAANLIKPAGLASWMDAASQKLLH
jgi:hypothetical protein